MWLIDFSAFFLLFIYPLFCACFTEPRKTKATRERAREREKLCRMKISFCAQTRMLSDYPYRRYIIFLHLNTFGARSYPLELTVRATAE